MCAIRQTVIAAAIKQSPYIPLLVLVQLKQDRATYTLAFLSNLSVFANLAALSLLRLGAAIFVHL